MALLRGIGLRLWSPLPMPTSTSTSTSTLSPTATPAVSKARDVVDVPRQPRAAPITTVPIAVPIAVPRAGAPSPAGGTEPGTLDWPALRQAVADCRACGLHAGRKQTVFGVGHPQAHWLVVGEAPGEQEDQLGEPFVGAAGQLLDRMLAALGLTRAEDGPQPPRQRVYIANTLKCRPPRNRNPAAEEMAQCEPFLVRQIELLQPRLILAMGRFAVQALLRSDEPIGKLRGRVHRYQGVPLVVTYHPAYLLRNPPDKAKAWEDLCLAASVVEGSAGP
ncbi:MAG: uracil-DNA glycosylase [Rubrivivax sp.]|nr:uracil-DNA glycosylase [Rubrivivax sp.]